ncbi:dead end protein 1 [Musca vetustissima]|uniref:dead end protein 1 n=1 Tax=Musca vetustissima TaxID=27455 RepID=UPI002AB79EA5|nr:dead end protein 1 [Musca vetustissima]
MINSSQQISNCSYARSVFEHPSQWYDSYQENGTKYLKSRKKLDDELQRQLNACVGEIFLDGIPSETRPEKIAEIASQLGEVYVLRFKVNFSGDSRGFAYLQYMNPSIMQFAIAKLPTLFHQNSLSMIRVRQSRNSSVLLLRKTYNMTPKAVSEVLNRLITFHRLIEREISPGNYEYLIVFKCNEEAVHARRELLRTITQFGRSAVVVWENDNKNKKYNKASSNSNYKKSNLDATSIHKRSDQIFQNLASYNGGPVDKYAQYHSSGTFHSKAGMNLPLTFEAMHQPFYPTNVFFQ